MDPIKLADQAAEHAAKQNDRYLFIFILIIVFAGAVWLFRWMIGIIDRKNALSEDRLERQTTLLEGLFREANQSRERVASVISDNTAHVVACTEQMRDNTEMLRKSSYALEKASLIIEKY